MILAWKWIFLWAHQASTLPALPAPMPADQSNIDKLLEQLHDVPLAERSARYQSVIVLMRHATDPTPIICHGSWEDISALNKREMVALAMILSLLSMVWIVMPLSWTK